MPCKPAFPSFSALLLFAAAAQASPVLIATGTLDATSDKSGLAGNLESGGAANVLGGLGSGLAWAGGNTFLAIPDRGPNATGYAGGTPVDNTQSFIARFQELNLNLDATPSGGLPFTLTAALNSTTLLSSPAPLFYGSTAGLPGGAPVQNSGGVNYFTGRSDGFGPGSSLNPNDARLDPEGVRVSNDGNSVFIADEYGPYVDQFDRTTGQRIKTFALPDHFGIANLNSVGAAETSGNTTGRVTNKGMEGLAISPDGKTLIGFMQSPLIQDGGDGGRANRIVTIDIATGITHEYAYDNKIGAKNYNSSEILALNDHQFIVLERDGKGLGDGSKAVVKQLWAVDLTGAQDVSTLQGETALLAVAPGKTLFLDMAAALKSFGIADTQIPAKLEGAAFGQDITMDGVVNHTLFVSNDNDFVPGTAGPSVFYAFAFTDADLAGMDLSYTPQGMVPEPQSLVLMAMGLGLLGVTALRRRGQTRA